MKKILLKKVLTSLLIINILTLQFINILNCFEVHATNSIQEKNETFSFSLPTVKSEIWRAITVTKECSSIDITISGEFESPISCGVYKEQTITSECIDEVGISLSASNAFSKETNIPVTIEEPGTYWLYITNASNINSYYYGTEVNTNTLICNYKVLLGDECENNNTYEKATPLIANTKQEFTLLGRKDVDFFKFTVYDLANPLELTIEGANEKLDSKIGYTLYRLNETTGELEYIDNIGVSNFASSAFNQKKITTYNLKDTGNYYVEVRNASGINSQYYSGDNETPIYITTNFSYDDTAEPIELAENEYVIKVYDDNGIIKDLQVIIDNKSYTTDERGYVIFKVKDKNVETVSVSIKADKYSPYYMNPFYLNKTTKISFIKLKDVNTSDYELMGARIGEYDVLNGTKKSCLRNDVETEIILQPYSEIGIKKYAIMQEDKIIAESVYRNIVVKGENFKVEKDVYAVIYGENDKILSKTMLNIKVISIDSSFVESLSLGKKFKFKVQNIPYFDNTEFEIDLSKQNIFTYEIKDDSVKIGFNIDIEGLSDKQIYKELIDFNKEVDGDIEESTFSDEFSIKTTTGLYSELKFSEGLLVSSGGAAFVKIKIKGESDYDFNLPIATIIVPITVGVGVEGSLEFKPEIQTNIHTNEVEFSNELEAELKLDVNVGVGVSEFSGGVYGEGSLKVVYKNLSDLELIEAKLQAGLYGKIGVLEAKQNLTDKYEFTLYPNNATKSVMSADLADTENYSIINRDYLSSRSVISDKGISLYGNYITNIQTSAYPYIEPQIVNCNGKILMAYLDDDGEIDNANFQHLVFSIYDTSKNKWSKPVKIDDNNYNENSFYLYTDNNNIYITYTELNNTITTKTTAEEMAKMQEIIVAKFDMTESKFINTTKITNNDTYDSNPKIAVINNIPIVTWINNSDNNMFGTTSNNSIYYSKYENEKWSSPVILANSLNAIINMESGILDNKFAIAYITDEDNNLTTYEDRKLYSIDLEKQNNLLISDINNESYVQFVNYKNKDMLIWKKEYTIQGITNKNGTISNIYENKFLLGTNRIKLTKNLDNEYMLSFVKGSNRAEGTKIYGVRTVDGIWRNEKVIYDNEGYVDAYGIAKIDAKGNYICVIANSKVDLDTFSKTTTLSSRKVNKINDTKITEVTDVNINGNTVNMKVKISNNGDYKFSSNNLSIRDNEDNLIHEKNVDIVLESGESKTIDIEFTLNNPISKENYKITNYNLPHYYFSLCYSDLEVKAEQLRMNDKNYISIKVTNNGYYSTKSKIDIYKVNATEKSMSDEIVKTIVVPELAYGESANYVIEATQNYFANNKTEGVVKIVATPVADVNEMMLLDNTCSVAIADFSEESEIELGDINADGKINARDARLALQYFAGKTTLTNDQKGRSDVNRDGKINARDARLILQYFAGKIKAF